MRTDHYLTHRHCVQCWNPTYPIFGRYCLLNRRWKAIEFALEGVGGRGSIERVAWIYVFRVIVAAKESPAWKVKPLRYSAGFIKSAKKVGELPQMVQWMSTEWAGSSHTHTKKTLTSATPYTTPLGGETMDTGHRGGRRNNRWPVCGQVHEPKIVLPGRWFQYSLSL